MQQANGTASEPVGATERGTGPRPVPADGQTAEVIANRIDRYE